jgi:DUF917 family protein
VLSSDTLAPIAVEQLRRGQQVTVLASPSAREWQSDAGIAIVGPAAFGYEIMPACLPVATHDE